MNCLKQLTFWRIALLLLTLHHHRLGPQTIHQSWLMLLWAAAQHCWWWCMLLLLLYGRSDSSASYPGGCCCCCGLPHNTAPEDCQGMTMMNIYFLAACHLMLNPCAFLHCISSIARLHLVTGRMGTFTVLQQSGVESSFFSVFSVPLQDRHYSRCLQSTHKCLKF